MAEAQTIWFCEHCGWHGAPYPRGLGPLAMSGCPECENKLSRFDFDPVTGSQTVKMLLKQARERALRHNRDWLLRD